MDCLYSKICDYSALNCDQDFLGCRLFKKYAERDNKELARRQEERRMYELNDMGLATRLNRGEDIERLQMEARN